jgi:DNA-binding phage protein
MTIEQMQQSLKSLYQSQIDGKDLTEISRRTGLSRFTVYQYFTGNGPALRTGGEILKVANDIIQERVQQAERANQLTETKN